MATPEPAPPEDPTRYRRKGLGFAFWAAMGFSVACLAGGIFIGFFWTRVFPPQAAASATIPSPGRLSSAEPVDSAVDAPPPTDTVVAATTPDSAGLAARVQRLELEQAQVSEAAAAALATAALLQASQTSAPFADELALIERQSEGRLDLVALRPLAARGAPTKALLASDFGPYAARAIRASRKPTEESSVLDRLRYLFAMIVTVRRVDYTEGVGPNAVLARAELKVHDGDLEGALDDLATLPEAPREAMTPWVENASRRVEIDRRIEALRASSLETLSVTLGART